MTLRVASSTSAHPAESVTLHAQVHKRMQTMGGFEKGRFDSNVKKKNTIYASYRGKGWKVDENDQDWTRSIKVNENHEKNLKKHKEEV